MTPPLAFHEPFDSTGDWLLLAGSTTTACDQGACSTTLTTVDHAPARLARPSLCLAVTGPTVLEIAWSPPGPGFSAGRKAASLVLSLSNGETVNLTGLRPNDRPQDGAPTATVAYRGTTRTLLDGYASLGPAQIILDPDSGTLTARTLLANGDTWTQATFPMPTLQGISGVSVAAWEIVPDTYGSHVALHDLAIAGEAASVACGPPAAPQPTVLPGPSKGEVTLSWSYPSSDGGSAVTGWRVESPSGSTALVPGAARSWISAGHPDGETLAFRVAALNPYGESEPSAWVSGRTPVAPSAPPDLWVKEGTTTGEVRLSWRVPLDTGGLPLRSYEIYRQGPADPQPARIGTSVGTRFDDRAALEGVVYRYTVAATTSGFVSAPSPTRCATIAPLSTGGLLSESPCSAIDAIGGGRQHGHILAVAALGNATCAGSDLQAANNAVCGVAAVGGDADCQNRGWNALVCGAIAVGGDARGTEAVAISVAGDSRALIAVSVGGRAEPDRPGLGIQADLDQVCVRSLVGNPDLGCTAVPV